MKHKWQTVHNTYKTYNLQHKQWQQITSMVFHQVSAFLPSAFELSLSQLDWQ